MCLGDESHGVSVVVVAAAAGCMQQYLAVSMFSSHLFLVLVPWQLGWVPPEGLARLTALRTLKLARSGLTTWPLPPVLMPELRVLVLAGNPGLRMLPPGALAPCAQSLTLLDLSGVHLFECIAAVAYPCCTLLKPASACWRLGWGSGGVQSGTTTPQLRLRGRSHNFKLSTVLRSWSNWMLKPGLYVSGALHSACPTSHACQAFTASSCVHVVTGAGVPAAANLRGEDIASCQRLEHVDLSRTGTSMFPEGVLPFFCFGRW